MKISYFYSVLLVLLVGLIACEKEELPERTMQKVRFVTTSFSIPEERPMNRAVPVVNAGQIIHLRYFLYKNTGDKSEFIKQWYYTRNAPQQSVAGPVYQGLIANTIDDELPLGTYTAVFIANIVDNEVFNISDTLSRSFFFPSLKDTLSGPGEEIFGARVDFTIEEKPGGTAVNVLLQHWGAKCILDIRRIPQQATRAVISFRNLASKIYFDGSIQGGQLYTYRDLEVADRRFTVYIPPSEAGKSLSVNVKLYAGDSYLLGSTFSTREILQGKQKTLSY